ncbi:unnamed protein product [Camellia sinensis]
MKTLTLPRDRRPPLGISLSLRHNQSVGMVYITSWDDFVERSVQLFRASPESTRYVMKYRHCDGKLVLKVTDNREFAETHFASSIVMLKRVKLIKQGLQTMVISDKWSCYRDDDIGKAKFVKDKLLDDFWWDQVDYILSFTAPIYDMIRVCDTDRPSLHLVYDMWDTMVEKVKMVIYKHEGKRLEDESTFYNVVHQILVDRWNKNNTPLHCLAHSLCNLLVQPSSSSCAERNWSIYSFIHSMRRNKMTPQRAEDLVFVHSNLRLLSRRTPQYHEGETKLWDIAGDTFDSFDDVGMLEVANLSLDEPEMEVVLFTDDGGANEEKGGDANDDEDCLKYKTDQAQDAKKMEKLNNIFFTLMARGPERMYQKLLEKSKWKHSQPRKEEEGNNSIVP